MSAKRVDEAPLSLSLKAECWKNCLDWVDGKGCTSARMQSINQTAWLGMITRTNRSVQQGCARVVRLARALGTGMQRSVPRRGLSNESRADREAQCFAQNWRGVLASGIFEVGKQVR